MALKRIFTALASNTTRLESKTVTTHPFLPYLFRLLISRISTKLADLISSLTTNIFCVLFIETSARLLKKSSTWNFFDNQFKLERQY